MRNSLRVLSVWGIAVVLWGPQSVFAECTGNAVEGFDCTPAGPVAIGAVFSTSDIGARNNIALALVEELLEEEGEEIGDGAGDALPYDLYASVLYGDKDYSTEQVLGLDSDTWGGMIGATLRGTQYFAGAAITYSKEDASFKENAGKRNTNELGFQLYGTYYPRVDKNFFLSGAFGYTDLDIDTKRTFLTARDAQQNAGLLNAAKGRTGGKRYGLLAGSGYNWPVRPSTVLSFSGWLLWQKNKTDGYTEKGALPQSGDAESGNLRYQDDDYSTSDGILTLGLIHETPISKGRLIPAASLSYVHEFESDTRTIDAELVDVDIRNNDPANKFISFRTNDADKNYFRAGASLTAQYNGGTTVFAAYNGVFGHDWRAENLFTVGVNKAF